MTLPAKQRSEIEAVRERYARRSRIPDGVRYDPLSPATYLAGQERERALIHLLRRSGLAPVGNKRLLEVGCGTGGNIRQLIKLGFMPENLVANELLEERLADARKLLPPGVTIAPGNALDLAYERGSFDVVLQSTVFSSLLDHDFRRQLARKMWTWVKPGGGIIWYDFTVNNPKNPDVRGVPLREITALFPEASVRCWKVTLAPPINRFVTKIHPVLYGVFNCVPFLRTHVLCWISKAE